MDEARAAALYDRVASEYPRWERTVRAVDPTVPEAEVRDRALRRALAELRQQVGQQTLAYLRWRVDQTRAAATATMRTSVALVAESRQIRAGSQAARALAPRGDGVRLFHGADGSAWTVQEIAVGDVSWACGSHCLLFQSEPAIRRVWHYPADWRSLPDAALEAVSWER